MKTPPSTTALRIHLNDFFFMFLVLWLICLFICDHFFVQRLQSPSQVQHGVSLSRNEGVDCLARLFGERLKGPSFHFMLFEHPPLRQGQFTKGVLQHLQKPCVHPGIIGSGSIANGCIPTRLFPFPKLMLTDRPPLSKEVHDLVLCHGVKPRNRIFYRIPC